MSSHVPNLEILESGLHFTAEKSRAAFEAYWWQEIHAAHDITPIRVASEQTEIESAEADMLSAAGKKAPKTEFSSQFVGVDIPRDDEETSESDRKHLPAGSPGY